MAYSLYCCEIISICLKGLWTFPERRFLERSCHQMSRRGRHDRPIRRCKDDRWTRSRPPWRSTRYKSSWRDDRRSTSIVISDARRQALSRSPTWSRSGHYTAAASWSSDVMVRCGGVGVTFRDSAVPGNVRKPLKEC